MGLRGRVSRLEREMDTALVVVVEHEDGTTSRFREEEIFPECFTHEVARGRRHFDGEDPGPAHPFIVALRTARNLEDLMSEHGTIVGHLLGEDEIIRGVRERVGPSVKWNDAGTVCE